MRNFFITTLKTQDGRARGARFLARFIFFVIVVLATLFASYKFHALGYDGDLNFYLEFAAKWPDPNATDHYSFVSIGRNFFGLYGHDGGENMHKSLHFEPYKYLFGLVYYLFGGWRGVFALFTLIYFSPILYLALIHPLKNNTQIWRVFVFILLYIGYPSTLDTVTFDLRPRVLFAPFLILVLCAIYYRRPLWEQALLFAGLLAVREEAIIFGFGLALFHWLTHDNPKESRKFTLLYLAGIVANLLFFLSVDYPYNEKFNLFIDAFKVLQAPGVAALAIIGSLLFVGVFLYLYQARGQGKLPQWENTIKLLMVFFLLSAPLIVEVIFYINADFQYTEFGKRRDFLLDFLWHSPHAAPLVLGAIWVGIFIWENRGGEKFNQTLNLLFGFAVLSVGWLTAQSLPITIQYLGRPDPQYIFTPASAADVWALRDMTDQDQTYILDDSFTHGAFYDYENVFPFTRLPWYFVPGEQRLYPENTLFLQEIISEKIEYIVVGRIHEETIDVILNSINLIPLEKLTNERFVIYQLH